ncbi:MAG: hypothetical protein OHK0019_35240 [Saprospiraceae bacterium]
MEHHISDVRIERFEKLDEQPRLECYLVYGYHQSIEQEVGFLIDRYVCDSIFPNIYIERAHTTQKKVLYFFRKTKNSNNKEIYRSKIKRAIAYRDIIFEYVFEIREDSTIAPSRKKYRVNEPDMVSEPFRCN